MKPFVAGTLVAVSAVSLTANALLYMRWSPNRPLVKVGSAVITKSDYQGAVDYQTQGAVLKKMVFADLVTQAAARAGVTPTDADVDADIADAQRRNPQALSEANMDPAKMYQLRQDVATDLALENLRIQGVPAGDAEVAAFYAQHKAAFQLPAQVMTTTVATQSAVDAATAASLLRQGISRDVIARQQRLHVVGMDGFTINFQGLPPAVSQKITAIVFGMKPGDTQTVEVGPQYYLTFRANKRLANEVPPLAQIKDQVTRMVRLTKAPTPKAELAKLYQSAQPQFNVSKYAQYFSDLDAMDVSPADTGKKTASAQ